MTRSLATIAATLAVATIGCQTLAQADVNEPPLAERLPGWWSYQGNYGPAVQGTLTLDGRDAVWYADLGGFGVEAVHDGNAVRFVLPGGQGAFRGRLRADRKAVDGFWVQPPGVTLSSAYATPIVLHAQSKGVWVGQVRPLPDRVTLFLNIRKAADGGLTGFIRNPEFNFGLRRLFKIVVQGNDVSFTNANRENDVLHGSFDPESGHLSMAFEGVGIFDFVRRDVDGTPGATPRAPVALPSMNRAPPNTGDGWPTAAPAAVGLRADTLKQLTDHVLEELPVSVHTPYVHAVLVARHGKLVFEEYFHGFGREQPHDTRSAGKTLTSILLGIAMEQARGFDVGTPVLELLPQYAALKNGDARKSDVTVGELLTMTSGLACDDNDDASPGNEDVMQSQQKQRDWYRYTLDLKMARDPGGTQAVYCSAGINLLGGIIAQRSGCDLPEFFQRYLAGPMQIDGYHMNLMPNGEGYGAGGIYLRPRDALKLGQLYLSRGRWNGHQLVSASWVDASTQRHSQFDDSHGYGYGWHLHEMKCGEHAYREYAAEGNGGQFIIVVPELDLTVLIAAGNYGDFQTWYRLQDLVSAYIIPAVSER
jgi:CubicO group peptidase (beta-lactamase class C family)